MPIILVNIINGKKKKSHLNENAVNAHKLEQLKHDLLIAHGREEGALSHEPAERAVETAVEHSAELAFVFLKENKPEMVVSTLTGAKS